MHFGTSAVMRVTPSLFFSGGRPIWEPEAGSRSAEADSLPPHGPTVSRHVVIVFSDGAGEMVMAGGVGDKIVVIAGRWMHGRLQRAFPGIADWAGRKSG